MNKFLLTIFLFLSINISFAFATENYADNVSKKLMEIAMSDKKITQKDYNDFWNTTGVKSRDQKINLIMSMKTSFIAIQEFNTVLWDCAEKSWLANKKIKCSELNKNFEKIKNNLLSGIGEEDFKKIEGNFNYIIESASNRGIDKNKTFNTLQADNLITLDKIRIAKIKSQNLLERVNILMQPDFTNH